MYFMTTGKSSFFIVEGSFSAFLLVYVCVGLDVLVPSFICSNYGNFFPSV